MADYTKHDRRGSPVAGVIILGIGLYFLAVQMDYLPPVGDSWPVFLIIVGIALIVGTIFRRGRPRDDREVPPQA